jgi:N-acetylmuramoyl-L-alanine amidase
MLIPTMRANMKLIVLLGMLILAAPAFGAARQAPVPPSRPPSTVHLRDWADQHGFKMSFDPKSLNILLTNRWANIELLANSRRGAINGITVWLSFPIRIYNGRLMIHQKDLATLFDPILYPKRLPGNRTVRLVALDPGHGGRDPGYQIGNHEEKKYTLLLAKEVQEALERSGLKAMLTRRSDIYVERAERPNVARKAKADLFVSLHYNTAADTSANGVETYAVTPFGAESTNGGEMSLLTYPGNKYETQSILLAYQVQRAVTRGMDSSDRGVRRAGFEVLRRATMPSILIESGFMSNSGESKKVFDEAYRKEMARAIVDGILAYKRIMERNTSK